ncbi:hypothetical protein RO3G_06661 [Rhizopus delemar RA 99-880]|uniref:Uncharacterized protein n=1 Tax=Rhizopus delemar (strain RA 99-880 / ATCC MYA-4621 / FGSC 9543 / NRRL 43880) TaxID=246409 RepID=I1C0H6_RHIO9|nr:hypothetical protein RO3G_06661 [Rhizopus delemar RA 99-880]|eukprot:EIE81956.1 hypothetical protein RO3G_06661 [Rhizopus delemar RA 99-880]
MKLKFLCVNWLLGGSPKTLNQARELDAPLKKLIQLLSLVIDLQVPENVTLQSVINIVINVKGNTSDGIYLQIEKEIENRLGVLSYGNV